jgi:hypothetical protein
MACGRTRVLITESSVKITSRAPSMNARMCRINIILVGSGMVSKKDQVRINLQDYIRQECFNPV